MVKYKRARVYIPIPNADITAAMINRSTSLSSECAKKSAKNAVDYTILEVEESNLDATTVYDNYTWYDIDSIKDWMK